MIDEGVMTSTFVGSFIWFLAVQMTCMTCEGHMTRVIGKSSDAHRKPPVPADLGELRRLGFSSDDVIHQIRVLLGSEAVGEMSTSGTRPANDFKRNFIRNQSVTCNDGSKAGYYLRKSMDNSRWLIFLEDGWFCFDKASCRNRWFTSPHLMSSDGWPVARRGIGILSSEAEENPFIHDGNLVYVPYCSSDSWSGSYRAGQTGEFSFMGSLIVKEVVEDLVEEHGLAESRKLFLTGSSAGGLGVLLNLDRIASYLRKVAPSIDIRGIADSAWFLDNHQFRTTQCIDAGTCSPAESAQRGIQMWRGVVPETCKLQYPHEVWKCYFGHRIYPTLQTPVFVVQPLFDDAQIMADNVGPPTTKEQWRYIHNLGLDMRLTLSNVSAVFAPACMAHGFLTRHAWSKSSIQGTTLLDALRCWESGRNERNRYAGTQAKRRQYIQLTHQLITGEKMGHSRDFLADEPFSNISMGAKKSRKFSKDIKQHAEKRFQHRAQQRVLLTHRRQSSYEQHGRFKGFSRQQQTALLSSFSSESRGRCSTSTLFDKHDFHHISTHVNRCNHHRLDHCNWPQCNPSCPKMRNPITGDELDLVDLLKQIDNILRGTDPTRGQQKKLRSVE